MAEEGSDEVISPTEWERTNLIETWGCVFYCSPSAHDEGKVPGDVRVIRFEVGEIIGGKTFPGLPN